VLPPGGDSAAGEELFIGACDVIAESKRAPVQMNTTTKLRHCDVIASSDESLLMTSLGNDVIYVINSGIHALQRCLCTRTSKTADFSL